MVRSFVEAILGEVGRQLLFAYEANAYWINWVVLAYGVIMFASWLNLVRIYRYLIVEMAKEAHTSDELNRKKSNKKIRDISRKSNPVLLARVNLSSQERVLGRAFSYNPTGIESNLLIQCFSITPLNHICDYQSHICDHYTDRFEFCQGAL